MSLSLRASKKKITLAIQSWYSSAKATCCLTSCTGHWGAQILFTDITVFISTLYNCYKSNHDNDSYRKQRSRKNITNFALLFFLCRLARSFSTLWVQKIRKVLLKYYMYRTFRMGCIKLHDVNLWVTFSNKCCINTCPITNRYCYELFKGRTLLLLKIVQHIFSYCKYKQRAVCQITPDKKSFIKC